MTREAALLATARRDLAGPLRDSHADHELTHLVLLRDDVAVACTRARPDSAPDEPIDLARGIVALYVFAEERWWVAARQETLVPGPGLSAAA